MLESAGCPENQGLQLTRNHFLTEVGSRLRLLVRLQSKQRQSPWGRGGERPSEALPGRLHLPPLLPLPGQSPTPCWEPLSTRNIRPCDVVRVGLEPSHTSLRPPRVHPPWNCGGGGLPGPSLLLLHGCPVGRGRQACLSLERRKGRRGAVTRMPQSPPCPCLCRGHLGHAWGLAPIEEQPA